ncbi:MAG TPA: DEAD/DEAH box helicase family protein [Candidatus Dormibacteraeota bacterium]|nr:DEAD/DEAH box helicase family protein [Candidatus Dormibacteraeota bacterium]
MTLETVTQDIDQQELSKTQELAAGLQRLSLDLPNRHYSPDIHQELALQAIGESLAKGNAEGHLKMATSTGKSLLISLLAEAACDVNKRTLILAPSITIAEQLTGREGTSGLGFFGELTGSGKVKEHFGGLRADQNTPVVVTTYQSLLNEVKTDCPSLGEFDLILADECHRSLGPETSKAMKAYMPQAVRIGFSATPSYATDRQAEEIFGRQLFEFSLRQAIEDGKASPVRALVYESGSSLRLSDRQPEFTDRELAPLIYLNDRNNAAVQIASDLIDNGRQGIIACVPGGRNAHARLLAGMLSNQTMGNRAIIAHDVGGHLTPQEQTKRLQAFQNGEVDILTFTKSLEEGWDSKKASFCLNMAPTTSPLRTEQLLGRILRPKQSGQESIFIDFVDKTSGLTKRQCTALHVLEVDTIDINRVLGSSKTTSKIRSVSTDIAQLFRHDLYSRFVISQGRLVSEVTISETEDSSLFKHWERLLAKEGLPAELPAEGLSEKLTQKYDSEIDYLVEQLGRLPTHRAVIDSLRLKAELSDSQIEQLGNFAVRSQFEQSIQEIINQSYDIDEQLDWLSVSADMQWFLIHSLSELESKIIRRRFGFDESLDPSINNTYRSIGKELGYSQTRISQVEARALVRLRRLHRRLGSWSDMLIESPPQKSETQEDHLYNLSKTFFGRLQPQIPVIDPSDKRPYIDRLYEAHQDWKKVHFSLIPDYVHHFLGKSIVYYHDDTDRTQKVLDSCEAYFQKNYNQSVSVLNRIKRRPGNPESATTLQRLASIVAAETEVEYLQATLDYIKSFRGELEERESQRKLLLNGELNDDDDN